MKITFATKLTILRILLIVPFVSFMLKINDNNLTENTRNLMRYFAIILFAIMAVSDAIDGHFARSRKQITKLGTFLDPVADKLLIASACLLLASKKAHAANFELPSTIVVIILAKDLLLVIGFIIVYFLTNRFFIAPAFVGKFTTVIQLSMIASILIAPEVSKVIEGWIWLIRFLYSLAALMSILATFVYILRGNRYIEQYEQNNTTNRV